MGDAYDELADRFRRISYLKDGAGVLYWDQQVMMPEGGNPARSKQLSALSAVTHDLLTDDDLADALDSVEEASLSSDESAVIREIRRQHERARKVPTDLVEELTEAQSEAQEVWRRAKAEDDFDAFASHLENLVEMRVERAGYIEPDGDPYRVMFEDGEPYLPLSRVEEVLEELRDGLVPLIEDIRASGTELADPFTGEFDEDVQDDLSRAALDDLGYPWDRGRLDTSPHPFTSGPQFDCRITTRYHTDDPIDALTATIHEFGHATYQLGLPDDEYGSPLGQSRSHGVHESQSRLWENHVGRTEPFWKRFLPTFTEHFPHVGDVSVREAYEGVNRINPDNLIRVEADELTYHLHIVLRAEIEREFVTGDLDISEIPQRWNDKMEAYLGVRPDTDAQGCLQDIHWTGGFANFQNYSIGSVLAAQLWAAIEDDIGDTDRLIREGEFDEIYDWLTENLHAHGQRYRTPELIEEATGEPLTASYFLEYAESKFGELYGL